MAKQYEPKQFQGEPGMGIHEGLPDGGSRRLVADKNGVITAKTPSDEARLRELGLRVIAAQKSKPADKPETPAKTEEV